MELERRQLLTSVLATTVIPAVQCMPTPPVPAPVLLVVDQMGNKHEWDTALASAASAIHWQDLPVIRHLVDVLSLPEWVRFDRQDCWDHTAALGAESFNYWQTYSPPTSPEELPPGNVHWLRENSRPTHEERLICDVVTDAMFILAGEITNDRFAALQNPASRWIGIIVVGDSALDLHLGGWTYPTAPRVAKFWLGRAACVSTEDSKISTRLTIPNLTREAIARRCLERLHTLAGVQCAESNFGMIDTRQEIHYWI